MISKTINDIKSYNKTYYKGSGYVKFNDYVNDKQNKIHDALYDHALKLFKDAYFYERVNKYKEKIFEQHGLDPKMKLADVPDDDLFLELNSDINKYRKELIDKYDFIEIKNEEYNLPSEVLLVENVWPYSKKYESLKEYWNFTNFNIKLNKSIIKTGITNENINDAKIKYIDFARGTAIVYSKMNDIEYEIDLNDIDYGKTLTLSQDRQLTDTFTKIRKK